MPDLMHLLWLAALCAATSAAVLLVFGWPWRAPYPGRVLAGWALAVAVPFFLGAHLVMEHGPRWPPPEGDDRLLLILLPATLLVELMAAWPRVRWWMPWPPRLVIAAAAARILLHGSQYLNDFDGQITPRWTPHEARLTLLTLAALLSAMWLALATLARAAPGRSLPLALALTCAAAGVTVLLSGYFSGGQLGLLLAASLAGATAASLALSAPAGLAHAPSVGLVGLFGILILGRYLSDLTTSHALLLFLAPLLCWVPELPRVRKLGPRLRGTLRVILVAIPLALVVVQAHAKFVKDSQTPSSESSGE